MLMISVQDSPILLVVALDKNFYFLFLHTDFVSHSRVRCRAENSFSLDFIWVLIRLYMQKNMMKNINKNSNNNINNYHNNNNDDKNGNMQIKETLR